MMKKFQTPAAVARGMFLRTLLLALGAFLPLAASAQSFTINNTLPDIERWMYANNGAPCDRPAGSVFGTFGDENGVDTRHAQHLLGWDTAAFAPTGLGPGRYLIRRCRVTLTINRGNLFAYDPTHDGVRTYFATNDPARLPDTDAGRPVELFGVGYRNGFDAVSFDQCALFGSNATGERNTYAAGWSTNGTLVDIGNNVGKTNALYPAFEVQPFAVGQTTNAAPGQLVPAGSRITFDLNLADPLVLTYVQQALDAGRLRLMFSSLHSNTGQGGAPSYPDFATHFNEVLSDPTRFELEGVAVRDTDSDNDGLPDDWERFYFSSLAQTDSDDTDGDDSDNSAELAAGTNPTRAASVLRLAATRRSDGMVLTLPVVPGCLCTLESTIDFAGWTPVEVAPVFDLQAGVMQWSLPVQAAHRFYRARVNP